MHRLGLSLLLLSLSALIALPLMGASGAPDAERPVRLCVDPAWAPFEYLDKQGQHQGMAADYWQRMTERFGLRTEIVPAESWEESLEKAKRRECDVLTLAMKTPDRNQHWLFTEPYVSYPFVLATRSEAPSVSRLGEVADKTLAAAGDAMLCQFTMLAQSCLRRGDLLARLGGEEFAALLFETNAEGAQQTAERIRACVAAEPRVFESHQIALTVSIGVTCIRENDSPESLLARADASLYAAKQVRAESGRHPRQPFGRRGRLSQARSAPPEPCPRKA